MAKKIVVFAEVKHGEIRKVSFEAIAVAKNIVQDGQVVGLLLGDEGDALADELIHYGADRVIVAKNEQINAFNGDAYTQAIIQVLESENPDGFIAGHTSIGKEITPRIAAKKEAGLISDVIDIEVDGDEVQFIRPIYSGKAFEKKKVKEGPIFATIRSNNIPALEKDMERSGETTTMEVEVKDLRTIVKEVVQKVTGGVELSEANVVVAGGRGVKSVGGFDLLKELADVLGGAVGASRGACDEEYCDYSLQIGQTGKVVTPDLYIACGISGAIQHVSGMSNSKVIVAINKDPEANIFSIADYGIVGDLFEAVPLLIEELKQVV